MELEDMSDDLIKKVAKDYMDGKLFGSWQMTGEEILRNGKLVFLPVGMSENCPPKGTDHVYAYYKSQIGNRGINGFPMFAEARFMSVNSFKKFRRLVESMEKALKEALGEDLTKTKITVKKKDKNENSKTTQK